MTVYRLSRFVEVLESDLFLLEPSGANRLFASSSCTMPQDEPGIVLGNCPMHFECAILRGFMAHYGMPWPTKVRFLPGGENPNRLVFMDFDEWTRQFNSSGTYPRVGKL